MLVSECSIYALPEGPGAYGHASANQRESVIGGLLLSVRHNVADMSLWLVPVDARSFQRTLAQPVDLSDWSERPDDFPDRAREQGVRTDQEQGSWERNRRNLKKMEPGDPLLVYRNSRSRYTATRRVGPMATWSMSAKNSVINPSLFRDARYRSN